MATTKKRNTTNSSTQYPWRSSDSPDGLGPAEQVAHNVLADRRDLLPSVERIMTADLADAHRLRAMELFRDSIGQVGDVHRDPRVAIARSASSHDESATAAPTDGQTVR
jgi:hypothetical protein